MSSPTMNGWGRGLLALGLVTVLGAAAAEPAKTETELSRVMRATEAAHAAKFRDIDAWIEQGKSEFRKKNYKEADKLFQQARARLLAPVPNNLPGELTRERLNELKKLQKELSTSWSAVILQQAWALFQDGRYQEALGVAGEAVLIDSARAGSVEKLTEKCRREMSKEKRSGEMDVRKQESSLGTDIRKEIELRYRKAQTYFNNAKYAEARAELEQIYVLDPFEQKGTWLLRRVYQKLYQAARAQQRTAVEEQLAYNTWEWIEPVLAAQTPKAVAGNAEIKSQNADSVYNRLEKIVFPNVEFDAADIMTVIRYLAERSKRYDPERVGVPVTTSFDQEMADGMGKITMSFSRIPMGHVLRYLSQEVGLKYWVNPDGSGVTIGPSNGEMRTQTFPLRSELLSHLQGGSTEGGAGTDKKESKIKTENIGKKGEAEDVKDVFGTERTTETKTAKPTAIAMEALKKYFEDRGIPFPEGSTISYIDKTNKLVIKNTEENLRLAGDLIHELSSIENPMVMIELKVVELTENDWQELGFDWVFNTFTDSSPSSYSNWNAKINKSVLRNSTSMSSSSTTSSSSGIVSVNSDGTPVYGTSTGTNSSAGSSSGSSSSSKFVNNLKLFPNFGSGLIDGANINLSLSINAVSQNLRTEVLSAPKIVTANDTTAHIKMIKQYFFPDSWDAPEVSTNNNFITVIPPVPDWGDSGTDIGILLEVKPLIGADKHTIQLDLHPQIVSYIGQTDDSVTIEQGTVELSTGKKTPYSSTTYPVWMPVIGIRQIDVTVKVEDGETLVLGGIIDNKTETLNDRWPVLGDIPLVGRLFASQYEKKKKTNMLIFVTARLVGDNGVPVERNKQRGIPEFDR